MTMSLATALRNTRLQALADAIDAAATPGILRIYTGPRPDTGAAITTEVLLATLTFADPCGTVADGVLTLDAITGDDSADADGTAAWARVCDGDGNFVLDLDVTATGGGGDVTLNTVSIVAGGPVNAVGDQTITEGGA